MNSIAESKEEYFGERALWKDRFKFLMDGEYCKWLFQCRYCFSLLLVLVVFVTNLTMKPSPPISALLLETSWVADCLCQMDYTHIITSNFCQVIYGDLFDLYADTWDSARHDPNVCIIFYEDLKMVGIKFQVSLTFPLHANVNPMFFHPFTSLSCHTSFKLLDNINFGKAHCCKSPWLCCDNMFIIQLEHVEQTQPLNF